MITTVCTGWKINYFYLFFYLFNVEIGTEAARFPEKEYIIGIFLAVYQLSHPSP
jgi:hypothetical protein